MSLILCVNHYIVLGLLRPICRQHVKCVRAVSANIALATMATTTDKHTTESLIDRIHRSGRCIRTFTRFTGDSISAGRPTTVHPRVVLMTWQDTQGQESRAGTIEDRATLLHL